MIRYALACTSGHLFDSWFDTSDAFDTLVGRHLVTCPVCGTAEVAKTIMAPAVAAARRETPAHPDQPAEKPVDVSLLRDGQALRELVKAFREKVLAGTQDVGARFPEQARRMHEGEIPHADIRGQATRDEARALLDDGILILPLPGAPDELN